MTAAVLAEPADEVAPGSRAADTLRALVVRGPVAFAVATTVVMAAAGLAQQVGLWRPLVAALAVVLGIAAAALVVRVVPVPDARTLPAAGAGALVIVALAAAVWAGATHGEHVAVRRDAGAYATYALSLARGGGVPIDPQLEVFDLRATDPLVRVSGGANYQVPVIEDGAVTGYEIVPQFFVGTPAVLTLGWWAGGWTGLFLVPAVLGAVGLVAFGALAAAVSGPRTAVLATTGLALTQPVLLSMRQTYSEPLAMIFLCCWALLLVAALAPGRPPRHAARIALLAGALAGAALFVRIDALREIVLLIPVVTVLVVLRHPAARAFVAGIVVTSVPAALAATPWDSPYIAQVWPSVLGLVMAGLVLSGLGLAALAAARTVPARAWPPLLSRLPWLASGGVVAAAAFLASRPLWMVDRKEPRLPGAREFVGSLQQSQGLPVDPTRTYAEQTVTWLSWWVGPVTVVVAAIVAAVLVHRGVRAVVRGGVPAWLPVLVVGLGATLLTLYRPAITPDHPWADRRLVTSVLPTTVLLAAVAVAWVAGRAATGRRRALGAVVAAVGAALVVVPAAAATAPTARDRTEAGQPEQAQALCDALPERAAILALNHAARVEWGPVLRSRCGVPLVGLGDGVDLADPALATAVGGAAEAARRNGYAPVLLVGSTAGGDARVAGAPPRGFGDGWTLVVDLDTTEPPRLMVDRPAEARPLAMRLWMMEM